MFSIEQTYDIGTMTALCRVARKNVWSIGRVAHIICWGILAVDAVLLLALLAIGGRPEIWMWLVSAGLLALQMFKDRLSGWAVMRQILPGTAHSTTVFSEDEYTVTADAAQVTYYYENITYLCETERYYFFFLGPRHGQAFDKQGFQTGTSDGFRAFMERKTGKSFKKFH